MKKQHSVTVMVTVRNSADTMKKCIDSILKQNYKNYKIYVTDAFSDDGTYEILKRYGKKIKLEQVKGNMAVAYNHMIKKVNTDFVAYTDADAVVDKNWIKTLVESFKPGIVAVGGTIKNPKGLNPLQNYIGRELEHRFSKMPKEVSRLPTMNLCVRTKIVKKVKFDPKLDVAQETEWGYRLVKHGKMIFNPKAIVWHYHRASWKNFFKQQMKYGRFVPRVYLSKKHIKRITGDEISTPIKPVQIGVMYLMGLSLILNLLGFGSFYATWLLGAMLLGIYFYLSIGLAKGVFELFFFILIYFIKNLSWCIGIFLGIIDMVKGK